MANSATEIINSALAKVGANRIIGLDDNNEQAKLMKQQYEVNKLALLGSHPWNFAIKFSALNEMSTSPIMGFSAQFSLPRDCIRVLEADIDNDAAWKIVGRTIQCDYTETINIMYLSSDIAEGIFSPMFAEALAAKMAADVCYSLTNNAALVEVLEKKADRTLREARSYDAQESQGDRFYADSWLKSRL